MEKSIRKEIENRLYTYFTKEKTISNLNKEIALLEKHIEVIRNEIEDNRLLIQNSDVGVSDSSNYNKQTILNIITKKEDEIANKMIKISDIQEFIRKIETECERIQDNLDELKEHNIEHIDLLKLRYGVPRHNEQQIAFKLHCSQSTVSRMKDNILNNIAKQNM